MIDLKQFEKDIRAIFGEGSLSHAYEQLPKHLGIEKDHLGNTLTYETLIKQFKRHHDQWHKEFGDVEPRFLKSEDKDKRKNIVVFLGGKWYQHFFDAKAHPRDKYLFGDVDDEYLTEQRKQFEDNNKTVKL